MDQDEANTSVAPGTTTVSRDVSEAAPSRAEFDDQSFLESKPPSPKPHPLSISFQAPSPTPDTDSLGDGLKDKSLGVEVDEEGMGVGLEMGLEMEMGDGGLTAGLEIPQIGGDGVAAFSTAGAQDLSQVGPDGELFEGARDMSQLQESDSLLGGPMVEQAMDDDPFANIPS